MSALRKAAAARLAEIRSRMITRLANRSFKMQPNAVDRVVIQALEKLTGPAGEPDPDLEHPDPHTGAQRLAEKPARVSKPPTIG